MKKLNIALLQLLPGKNTGENLQKGASACRKAKDMGADIALFPEMWSSGYFIPDDISELKKLSVPTDGEFVLSFGKLAAELDMAIGITILESFDPLPKNTLILFDRHGKRVLSYSKLHTCDFGEECRLGRGEDFFVSELDTAVGNVRVGAMICFDREFPESARILMLKGAEVILAPNACPMEINRLSALRTRSYENMCAIATCNYPEGQPDCNGHSTIFDGVAWLQSEPGSRDMCILEADGSEGIFLAGIDLDMLREYRSGEVMGNAYRRPEKYSLLTEEDIREPFIRKDRRE